MAAAIASRVPTLSDIATWATAEEVALTEMLLECGQEHVFAKWVPGAAEASKRAFYEQVRSVEKNYPGGCKAYTANARELLRSSAAGENPFANMKPEVRATPLAARHTPRLARAPPAAHSRATLRP